MLTRRRTLLITAGAAVGSLGVGLFAGTRMSSPADAAAKTEPPKAAPVTVPVEHRVLRSEVVTRADVEYAGQVDVKVETAGRDTPAVVTGKVPDVGSKLREGRAILEVAGRPVLVLDGVLPAYRTLRPGLSGPDVEQLEKILSRLGHDPGTVNGRYTAATGRAVEALYRRAGYRPPSPGGSAKSAVSSARQRLRDAKSAYADAKTALSRAKAGPSEPERVEAQNAVDAAKRALKAARRTGDANAVADAEDQLKLARARQRELLRGKGTAKEKQAVENASERVTEAEKALEKAQNSAATPLPVSEVVYVSKLPRRVDDVKVKRGQVIGGNGKVLSASGAALAVNAEVDAATRKLLEEDMRATLSVDGSDIGARITSISEAKGDDGEEGETRYDVVFTPRTLDKAESEALRGSNVRVTVPITSTRGKVLVVPLAALSASSDGRARVQVRRKGGTTERVVVDVGLSAGGHAEVRPIRGELAAGDQVVVGR